MAGNAVSAAGGKMRRRSTRRSVEATTSIFMPEDSSSTTSPGSGMRPSISLTRPSERGGFVAVAQIAQIGRLAEEIRQLIDGKVAGDQPDAARLALRVFDGRLLFVLVFDVADDLLQQILNGDQARRRRHTRR